MTAAILESAATTTGTGTTRAKEEDEEMYIPLSENEGLEGSRSSTTPPPLSAAVLRARLSTAATAPALKSPFVVNDIDWSDFWTHLQPTMHRVKRRERRMTLVLGVTVLLAFVLAIVVVVATAWLGGHVYPDYRLVIGTVGTLLNYTVILAALWIFCIYQGRTYLGLKNEIHSVVCAYEQSTGFQERHGWHIDCQHDPMGFVLYISNNAGTSRACMEQRLDSHENEKGPVHVHANGSLRILLSAHFFGWSPVSLSHLQSNESRSSGIDFPSGFESLQLVDWWNEFWRQCAPLALQYQRARSMITAAYWCMALLCIPMIVTLPRFTPFLSMFGMALFVPCESYVAGFALRMSHLIHQYQTAPTCSPGYYIYLQDDVHEFSTRYMGIMYTARYLVVAPMPHNDKTA